MNVVLFKEDEIVHGKAILTDHRAKHIVKVLQSGVGETIKIGLLNGGLGTGRIVDIANKYPFKVELLTTFDTKPPPKTPVDLILALPRPIMLRRIFSQSASLGIGSLHIVNANRVEKSFWNSGLLDKDEYMLNLVHGLEQAVDTIPPKVVLHKRFKPFIEDYFPTIADQYSHLLYAHPARRKWLHQLITPKPNRIMFAIGPEGGWVSYEEEKFRAQGFSGFTVGQRILKVDTAVVNIHGRIMAELERIAKNS